MNHLDYNGYFSGRTVLVTGGAGFVGSHLTQHLATLNCQVRVLDDLSSGYISNLEGIDTTFIEGSILDKDIISRAANRCSIIFHQAAMVSVPRSIENPEICNQINLAGTKNIIEAAIAAGIDRVIFASSAACYGNSPLLPSSETDKIAPESPYAKSKARGELLMKHTNEIDTVSLRYFNIFGSRQDHTSQYAAVVSSFADAIQHHQTPVIFGDGNQTRDFTHVSNVVHANLLAASSEKTLGGGVFNVGTGRATSILQLLRLMQGNDDIKVDFKPSRKGDVQHSCANIESISKELGYQPIVETATALKELVSPIRN